MLSVDRPRSVDWDGKALSGWIVIDGEAFRVSADRDTIHKHAAGWDDALTWEINRFRNEIFDKLKPHFFSNHRRSDR
ncbi:hypothetical protein [Bradyrhizobium centrosematis]|uniref:hypothetical protein n=1 Tax=Bradyrhizobium centrosematis TaxID=1300039 RepID=UPI002168967E|nr:hypothetical protein [Bradyrhizobium centrosematis]MCS3765341.1 hypothetical protein [Bradyrhizobium centrosematis]MCS3773959.1 hypothetical protein [Bradyrhizobium centrosematis]